MKLARHRTILSAAQGDPGIFSSIARTVGRAVGGFVRGGPLGAVGAVIGGGSRPTAGPGGSMPRLSASGGESKQGRPRPGIRGAAQRLLPGGESGYITSRRMNPGNAKAARRAIRRIKSVRRLLQGIEKQLPRRKCTCGGAKRRVR